MKILILALFALSLSLFVRPHHAIAQDTLYSRAYGKASDPALIFLHGGPGYNSYSFEQSTAQPLADLGYYVIVYDQRGCGRSKTKSPQFTLEESINDLNSILTKYRVNQVGLIGHSWGGTLAIKFAKRFPEKIHAILLVGSPLSYQETLRAILANCRKVLSTDTASDLTMIDQVSKMDTASLPYASATFSLAMQSGLYTPKSFTTAAKKLYFSLKHSSDSALLSNNSMAAVIGLYKHEHYTTFNMTQDLTGLVGRISIMGIYGEEDGLFDAEQIKELRAILGDSNLLSIKGASHNVFIDQQEEFLKVFK